MPTSSRRRPKHVHVSGRDSRRPREQLAAGESGGQTGRGRRRRVEDVTEHVEGEAEKTRAASPASYRHRGDCDAEAAQQRAHGPSPSAKQQARRRRAGERWRLSGSQLGQPRLGRGPLRTATLPTADAEAIHSTRIARLSVYSRGMESKSWRGGPGMRARSADAVPDHRRPGHSRLRSLPIEDAAEIAGAAVIERVIGAAARASERFLVETGYRAER